MKRRVSEKAKRSAWITRLGLINAAAILIGSSTDLGLPDTAVKWVLLMGAVALIWKGMLEQEERDARRVLAPKEPDETP